MTRKPTETLCPICTKIFLQPDRPQGGGRRTIYCSSKCRNKNWVNGNGPKRKATIIKYDTQPENKQRKQERTRLATLKRYKISEIDFKQRLSQQNERCLGCMSSIDQSSARIDHNHITGKVRGLLCDHCNWAIGHVKESLTTLRSLILYLEHHNDLSDRIS